MRTALGPELADVYSDAAKRVLADQGLDFDPERLGAAASNWADRYVLQLSREIANTSQVRFSRAKNAANETAAAQRHAEALDEVIDRIFTEARAETIAITEVTRANTMGEFGGRDEFGQLTNGLPLIAIWQTAGGENVCPVCEPLDGARESEWSAEFTDGPPAHPGCRCEADL